MFDLRNFREEALKLTQKELADLIDERQDKISRLEKNPDSIGLDILIKIADKTGTTLDELVRYKKKIPEALKINDTWNTAILIRKTINDYVNNAIENKITGSKKLQKVNEIKKFTEMSLRKPKIAVVGLSDTGKSTLINSLLGAEKMPAAWTPTTAISIYMKHIDERPSYIQDDVWFFKPQAGNGLGWDSNRLSDEVYTKEFFVRKGHIQDLQEFAVRRDMEDVIIGSAVVFIDSPILKVCDIIDLPGYNTGDRELDTILTEHVREYADIMIYMSLANGFMRGNDIEYLKSDLNYIPVIENKKKYNRPLSNFYVIASQAHVVNKGNGVELEKILDEGAIRLYSQIPHEFWEQRSVKTGINYTVESLRGCFFTYSKDIEALRKPFELDLTSLIEDYSNLLIDQYKMALQDLCEINRLKINRDIKGNLEISHKRDDYISLAENLSNNVSKITKVTKKLESDIDNNIQELNNASLSDFSMAYEQLISIESVIDIIEKEGYTNVKGDMEKLGSLLNSKLQENVHAILKVRSFEFAEEIENFIKDYDILIKDISNYEHLALNFNYSTKSAFVKGLADCKSIGANAAWTSTLGDIGTYSILGEGVNVLSELLYSVPGEPDQTYTEIGGVANGLALSGVIGLGIGLAILAITSGMSTFGSGWKKSVAKKIVAAYKNEKVLDAYMEVIEGFWKDTDRAFRYVADYIEKDFCDEISELTVKVIQYDTELLEYSIKMDNNLVEFYDGIEQLLLDL